MGVAQFLCEPKDIVRLDCKLKLLGRLLVRQTCPKRNRHLKRMWAATSAAIFPALNIQYLSGQECPDEEVIHTTAA